MYIYDINILDIENSDLFAWYGALENAGFEYVEQNKSTSVLYLSDKFSVNIVYK